MPSTTELTRPSHTRRGRWQLAVAVAFVAVHLVAPLLVGELYPFTVAPMFCDRPQLYCNYHVYGPDGRELPAADFLLQRVYDGNPPGFGVGIQPPPVLDRFGRQPTEQEVIDHVRRQLADKPELPYVDVVQEVIGPVSNNRVGVMQTNRWRVEQSTKYEVRSTKRSGVGE